MHCHKFHSTDYFCAVWLLSSTCVCLPEKYGWLWVAITTNKPMSFSSLIPQVILFYDKDWQWFTEFPRNLLQKIISLFQEKISCCRLIFLTHHFFLPSILIYFLWILFKLPFQHSPHFWYPLLPYLCFL